MEEKRRKDETNKNINSSKDSAKELNRVARFKSEDDTLTVILHRGKKNIRVSVRVKTSEERRVKVYGKRWFELNEYKHALENYEMRIQEAKDQGWEYVDRRSRASDPTLDAIPKARKKRQESK